MTSLSSTSLVQLAQGEYTASQLMWNDTALTVHQVAGGGEEAAFDARYFSYWQDSLAEHDWAGRAWHKQDTMYDVWHTENEHPPEPWSA